jgi:cullin 4
MCAVAVKVYHLYHVEDPSESSTERDREIRHNADPNLTCLMSAGLGAPPPDFVEKTLRLLRDATIAIYQSSRTNAGLEALYRAVDDLCTFKFGAKLYEQLMGDIQTHSLGLRTQLVEATRALSDLDMLPSLHRLWLSYFEQNLLIRSIFLCLDRKFVMQSSELRLIWDECLRLFRANVLADPLDRRTVHGLLEAVRKHRNADEVDHSCIKALHGMLRALNLYVVVYEPPLLEASRVYYEAECDRVYESMSLAGYLEYVDNRVAREIDRARLLGLEVSERALQQIVEKAFLQRKLKVMLVDKDVDQLFIGHSLGDLSRLYRLFARMDGLEEVRGRFTAFTKVGTAWVDFYRLAGSLATAPCADTRLPGCERCREGGFSDPRGDAAVQEHVGSCDTIVPGRRVFYAVSFGACALTGRVV